MRQTMSQQAVLAIENLPGSNVRFRPRADTQFTAMVVLSSLSREFPTTEKIQCK